MRGILYTVAGAAGALLLSLGAATSASAALTLTDPDCDLYGAAGCQFVGGNDDNTAEVEAAYNAQHVEGPAPATIDLIFLGKIEAGPDFPQELSSYDWLWNTPVSFISVKGGQSFVLYGLDPAATSGTATNAGLLKGSGQCCAAISHITFYGTQDGSVGVVPEPGTWALMILGFGGAGAMLRQRRRHVAA